MKAFKKQRNRCVKILRQAKKDYYNDLDIKDLADSKKFWKSVKSLFNENIKTSSTIVLMENDELVSEDRTVANILNEYFSNVAKFLNIANNNENALPVDGISDPAAI